MPLPRPTRPVDTTPPPLVVDYDIDELRPPTPPVTEPSPIIEPEAPVGDL